MYSVRSLGSLILFSTLLSGTGLAQEVDGPNSDTSLQSQIREMDSLLFDVAFNQCDLELFKTIVSPNLEFYDDRSGLNTSFDACHHHAKTGQLFCPCPR